jgi:dTDP-4-dehydrorhamnose reductase
MAQVLNDLSQGRTPDVPALAGSGWWRRESRLIRAVPRTDPNYEIDLQEPQSGTARPLLIVGDDDDLARLVVRACEARGLYYTRVSGDFDAALARANPWAVFDARDHGGICGAPRRAGRDGSCCPMIASAAAAANIPSARITDAAPWAVLDALPGLLEVRTGEMFVPWDREERAVAMLEALEDGERVRADQAKNWGHVYGPDVVDLTLDLLIDGMTGTVNAAPQRMSELSFAKALALVADCDPSLVVATGSTAEKPLFLWSNTLGWLPPCESSLERFVREARAARRLGDLAVTRRRDESHLEIPAEPMMAAHG